MQLTISLAQIDIALGNPEANLQKAAEWVEEAARRGSDLVVFPEMWTTGYDWDNLEQLSALQHETISAVSELAKKHNIWFNGSFMAPCGCAACWATAPSRRCTAKFTCLA